jgi:maleylpyruvate isomerase
MIKLYSYWRSTSSWRVRIALQWKELAHEIVPVHLLADGGQQHRPEYLARNPMGQVPLLEVTEAGPEGARAWRLGQSLAILAYLEERYPAPALLPDDLVERAMVRQLAELVSSGIQPLQNIGVLNHLNELGQDGKAWAQRWIRRGLLAFDQIARQSRGAFCVGDRVSWADVCLIPQLFNARRFGADVSDLPALLEIEARCAALEAFQRAHPDVQVDAPAPA